MWQSRVVGVFFVIDLVVCAVVVLGPCDGGEVLRRHVGMQQVLAPVVGEGVLEQGLHQQQRVVTHTIAQMTHHRPTQAQGEGKGGQREGEERALKGSKGWCVYVGSGSGGGGRTLRIERGCGVGRWGCEWSCRPGSCAAPAAAARSTAWAPASPCPHWQPTAPPESIHTDIHTQRRVSPQGLYGTPRALVG